VALGKGLFAGPAVPSALCREFPLGTASAVRNDASAESKVLSAEPWNPVVYASAESKVLSAEPWNPVVYGEVTEVRNHHSRHNVPTK
jgi:hypothetical protein